MAWLSNYSNRKELVLTGGASGAQTNFQLKITVSYAAAMQGDFDDLRFTQADGTTLVDAWAEVIVTDTSTTVWVEFPSTPANTVEQTYYMYYGHASPASDWDGAATFIFFDGWEDGSDSDWVDVHAYHAPSTDQAKHGTYSEKMDNSGGSGEIKKDIGTQTNVSITVWAYSEALSRMNFQLYSGATGVALIQHDCRSGENEHYEYYDGSYNSIKQPVSDDTWHKIELNNFNFTANTYDIWLDDVKEITGAGFWNAAANFDTPFFQSLIADKHTFFDSIHVRKYAANPPTYTFGNEESLFVPTIIIM